MKNHTLRKEVLFSGVGLHRGTSGTLRLCPSEEGRISFCFGEKSFDLREAPFEGGGRGTTLFFGERYSLATVEHLLGALTLCEIWSVRIVADAEEVPMGDGSASFFSRELFPQRVPLSKELLPFYPGMPLVVGDPGVGPSIALFPASRFGVTYAFEHPHPCIGSQWKSVLWDSAVREELEGARTFGFLSEVEALRKRGLAQGGSLKNAVVFDETQVMNPEGLRFPDECVRHKMVDLLGDLMLLGRPLVAHVVALRAGHATHLRLVERLRRAAGKV